MRNLNGVALHLGASGSQLSSKENTAHMSLAPKAADGSKTCPFSGR